MSNNFGIDVDTLMGMAIQAGIKNRPPRGEWWVAEKEYPFDRIVYKSNDQQDAHSHCKGENLFIIGHDSIYIYSTENFSKE